MKPTRALVGFLIFSLILTSVGLSNSSAQTMKDEFREVNDFEHPEFWSRDYGVTFKNSTSRNSTSTIDDEGNLHVVWEDNRSGSWNIYYLKLWNDDGQKLINDMKITSNNKTSLNPKVVVDDSNHIYIVWEEYTDDKWRLFFAKLQYSPNNIKILEEKVPLCDMGIGEPKDYSILLSEKSFIHIVFERRIGGDNDLYYQKINLVGEKQIACNIKITDTDKDSKNPQIVQSVDGYVDVIWIETFQNNRGLFYKKIDNFGNTEVKMRRLTVVERITRFDIGISSSGNMHVVFDDNRYHDHKMDVIYTKLSPNGTTLIDDLLITKRGDDNNSFSPSLSIDDRDEIYICWADSRDYKKNIVSEYSMEETPHEIYFKKLDNEGNFIRSRVRLTGHLSYSYRPSIVTDMNNNQHIIWEDDRDDKLNIYYKNTMKPDLKVNDIVLKPKDPTFNSTVNVSIILENTGENKIYTKGELYLGSGSSKKLLHEYDIKVSENGIEEIERNYTFKVKGEKVLTFIANPKRDVEEIDYSNNMFEKQFSVSYYDLQIGSENETVSVYPGKEARFDLNVLNLGNDKQDVKLYYQTSEKDFRLPESEEYEIDPGENLTTNFTVNTPQQKLAGEYNVTLKVESLTAEDLELSKNFTVEILPVYDLSFYIETNNITKPKKKYNYTVNITVVNTANDDQRIMLYVIERSEYAYVSPSDIILKPGESRVVQLDISGIVNADRSKDITISVTADSQNTDISRSDTVTIEGKGGGEEDGGIFGFILGLPWMWIGIAAGAIVGGIFAFIFYRNYFG